MLNDLCEEAKAALIAGEISLSQAEALTLGGIDAQRGILEEIERGYDDFSAAAIRAHFLDDRPTVAMAVFPLERYTGTITTDLFAEGETSYFDDEEQFFALQQEAVERLAAEHEGKAAWVEVTGCHSIPDWQYREARGRGAGRRLINLSPSGRVEIREGLARPEIDPDTREATAEHPAAPSRPKAAYSVPLRRLIAWHKSAAIQELLLSDPRKAREVAVLDRLVNAAPHQGLRQLSQEKEPGRAYAAIEAQARLCAGWLGIRDRRRAALLEAVPAEGRGRAFAL